MEEREKTSRVGRPLFCDMIITHQCFFRCQMCVEWKNPPNLPMLSFEECKRFIDELATFVDYPLDINIMGGEPFMVEWLLPLCDYIHEKGFKPIVSTNGYLIDEALAQKIAASHLKVLVISLDATQAKIHDAIRGKAGAHQRIIDAIKFLNKYRSKELHLGILSLILESNLEELPVLVRWTKESGLVDAVSFLGLVESGLVSPKEGWFKKEEYKSIWPQDPGRTQKTIDAIIQMKREGYPVTNPFEQLEAFKEYYRDPEKFLNETEYCIQDYIIDIDPEGGILLSGHPLGSLKEKIPLRELWFSPKANEIRDYIKTHGCDNSRSCLINFICAFRRQEENDSRYCAQRGLKYQQAAQHELALAEFKKAVELQPMDGIIRLGIAYNYFKLGNYEAAIKEYDDAFKVSPEVRTSEVIEQYVHIEHLIRERRNLNE